MKKTYILATFCLSVFTTCDIVAIRERRLVNLKEKEKAHKKVSNNEINAGAYDKLRENVMRIQSILTGAKAKIREFYSYINDRTINDDVRMS